MLSLRADKKVQRNALFLNSQMLTNAHETKPFQKGEIKAFPLTLTTGTEICLGLLTMSEYDTIEIQFYYQDSNY